MPSIAASSPAIGIATTSAASKASAAASSATMAVNALSSPIIVGRMKAADEPTVNVTAKDELFVRVSALDRNT